MNASKLSPTDSQLLSDPRLGIEGLHIVYKEIFTLHIDSLVHPVSEPV